MKLIQRLLAYLWIAVTLTYYIALRKLAGMTRLEAWSWMYGQLEVLRETEQAGPLSFDEPKHDQP